MTTQTLLNLAKVPLLLVSAYQFGRCFTPPQGFPPTPKISWQWSKSTAAQKREWFILSWIRWAVRIQKTVLWTTSLLDCLSIISTIYPELGELQHQLPHPLQLTPRPTSTTLLAIQTTLLIISILGGTLRLASFGALGAQFTFNISPSATSKLVTTGPYSIVRHPSYLGVFMLNSGLILYHLFLRWAWGWMGIVVMGFWASLLSISISTTMWRSQDEDEMLKRKFGKEWEAWRKVVRWRVIPGVY
ncbi:hypothetical protein V5O48_014665 [Marasmius crinis-equi]|uniref:Protein-S-isoprenylcysteine O-methyltransferase n=1 Tax=Marasmius crinis-equi TaxID=585013 RepID=A0ABR3EWQ4_9AGAR